MGKLLMLIAVKESELPAVTFENPIPIATLSFDQLKIVFVTTEPLKGMLVSAPEQTTRSITGLILGIGFT